MDLKTSKKRNKKYHRVKRESGERSEGKSSLEQAFIGIMLNRCIKALIYNTIRF